MKRVLAIAILLLMLCGCGSTNSELNRGLKLRENILKANECTFNAVITADYGDKFYTFTMDCKADAVGTVSFTVTEPETISGICGTISENEGKLTFDDQALVFETLADGQISPVSAPWLLVHTLRGGYIKSCGKEGGGIHMVIDDSYKEDALQLDIWTDHNDLPVRGEIIWQGRRVVTIAVENFTIV
jgi:hypothetical protein